MGHKLMSGIIYQKWKIFLCLFASVLIFIRVILPWTFASDNDDRALSITESKLIFQIFSQLNKIGCNLEHYVLGIKTKQTDPCLIEMTKKLLIPPPPYKDRNRDPINLKRELSGNLEKFGWIEKLLVENNNPPRGTPGFFIECGANDGLFISSTLRIEKSLNWTGLLVEANPKVFKTLVTRKRNVWAMNAAACVTPHPEEVPFFVKPNDSGMSGLNETSGHGPTERVSVQCIPLYTMLSALNVNTVDFLNLDVEGFELAVLQTIPFDKVTFKILAVEVRDVHENENKTVIALTDFLKGRGYRFVKVILDYYTRDALYVHESLYDKDKILKISESIRVSVETATGRK